MLQIEVVKQTHRILRFVEEIRAICAVDHRITAFHRGAKQLKESICPIAPCKLKLIVVYLELIAICYRVFPSVFIN